MADFRSHFDDLLAKRGLSCAAFAKMVDVSPSFLSDIRSGRNVIPPARVEQWADTLGLKGAERRDFLLIAMLPKCPEAIRPYIVKLIGQR